jgi:2-oxo-4-hydroxy-4-carboxy-5-ureidoimidazoline decarboxylase
MDCRLRPSQMDRVTFVATFGHVFEESPWIAATAYDRGLPKDGDHAEGLHRALCKVLREADAERQRALIEAHPDLAGRLAQAGQLTADSTREQAGAGLDRLSDKDYQRFTALNEAYRARFGVPFIMAIKGRTKEEILEAFEHRLENDEATEFRTALAQIERIALLRLTDLLPS